MSYFDEIMDAWTDAGMGNTLINRMCVEYHPDGSCEVFIGHEDGLGGVDEISLEMCGDHNEAKSILKWFSTFLPSITQYEDYNN